MLKLKNVRLTNDYIEATYIPESSDKSGYVKINLATNETESTPVKGYEGVYITMAMSGLRRVLSENKQSKRPLTIRERVVMWY